MEVTDVLRPRKDRAAVERPVVAALEALVPRDQFYRHLERRLDLGFAPGEPADGKDDSCAA